ncbi:MAG: FeoB-associated Cys-rich membrane protein [Treponema sp.]|nr:FeoB-associated Cys-rich membrane protein [Treponema sp.]
MSTVIAAGIVFTGMAFIIFRLIKNKRRGSCGCEHCPHHPLAFF